MSRTFRLTARAGAAVLLLASCGATGLDPDLRGWMPGTLNTADAAARATPRPQPDSRGIISFPNYQVVVAQNGDTPTVIARRLGIDGARLAQHNALPAGAPLAAGQILVLPQRVGAAVRVEEVRDRGGRDYWLGVLLWAAEGGFGRLCAG